MKTGKETIYSERGGEKGLRKTEIAMEDCIRRHRKSGRRMEKKEQEVEGIGDS